MKWYVYTLSDPRTNEIFYVGKGQRYRMYNHYWAVKRGKVPHSNYKLFRKIKEIINSDMDIIYDKVFRTDDEHMAYEFERKLITEIGMGSLCNLFDGFAGSYSGDKHWNFGNRWSDEVKRKIGSSKKGQFHSPQTKNKIKEHWATAEHPMKGKNHTKEAKNKMSENHADFNGAANPFFGKHHSDEIKEYYKNLYAKVWEVTLPSGERLEFLGKKAVVEFVKEYNKEHNVKVSAHSLFQYGKNKHNWSIKLVKESQMVQRGKWAK